MDGTVHWFRSLEVTGWVGLGQVFASLVLAVITWRYVRMTNRMADEMAAQRLDAIRPVLTLNHLAWRADGTVHGVLRNVGSGPAFDIRCTAKSAYVEYDATRVGSLGAMDEMQIDFAPPKRWEDLPQDALEKDQWSVTFTITYDDLIQRQWTTRVTSTFFFETDFDQQRQRIRVVDKIEPELHVVYASTPKDEGPRRRQLREWVRRSFRESSKVWKE
ncbi:hypothetical protein [Sphaerobacter thermophilus]|uniref:Uncharacterized protein n=1 Tax=Sphaerobacter thermophilus (strain ATCC 49802 / DSM 20745 / KCCM 41009 / NCIMB 13125 / S 6022) TaxID=479434 RepID=D1C3C9_SPHTD|nr:hypothetical protein [Sphaerobacter thermophilus]ACZ38746.1 hypothetical protein Sthe_1311 [Sphaerobacter thermophilus DSM 20745]PZN63826.1 MAG: hypothetical protein DIU58_10120 [Sphaerobacter thermophilus]